VSTSQEDQDIVEASFWAVLCRRHRRTKTSWRHRSGPSCVKEVFSFQILQLPIIGSLKTKPKNKQKEKTKFFNYNSYCYGGHVAVVDRCVVTSTDRQQGKLCQMTDESKTGTDLTWLSRACMCWQTRVRPVLTWRDGAERVCVDRRAAVADLLLSCHLDHHEPALNSSASPQHVHHSAALTHCH